MLKGKHFYLRPFTEDDVTECLNLEKRNRSFFAAYSIEREEDFYTEEAQLKRIRQAISRQAKEEEYHFGMFLNEEDKLIGTINLFQVKRGPVQCALIGYVLDKSHNGKGYMTEAAKLVVDFGFNELKLHRIEAGVMPHNTGSIRVLEKAGFHKEGIAKKNVKINGKWEDHQVLAIINPEDM
ncbi:GNAT family N-acetyltransferase [Agaribacter marinus]|uniref:GNAT family N-acetyltransferase n=1 Tax=Virgibacillus salarius TaxID=447199 RepID=A0A941DXW1_9BACI|nr:MULTISPECIES: GNAT family protein [Bacillaceae]MBR7797114.1 GNAT family N-acetyltransferase [Virgibacillus salarius]NAZ09823.1 GNAT family N-acetyltransferase [Agaribacter marinus]